MHRGNTAKTESSDCDGAIFSKVTSEQEKSEQDAGQFGLVYCIGELHDASVVKVNEVRKDLALYLVFRFCILLLLHVVCASIQEVCHVACVPTDEEHFSVLVISVHLLPEVL